MRLAPSGRTVRFVAMAALLGVGILVVSARWMIHPIRTDGGTPTEYLFFGSYALVLMLAAAHATLRATTLAGAWLGRGAEATLAVALAAVAGVAIVADVGSFALLGLHPYGRATWSAVSSADIRQHLPGWAWVAALALAGLVALATVLLWRFSGHHAGGGAWARLEAGLPRRLPLYFAVGLVTFLALDSPDEERVVPRAALPFYDLWLAAGNRFPDPQPAYPLGSAPPTPAFSRRPVIVFVLVESLRWDIMTPQVMPFLSQLASRPGCVAAPRHYAGGHLTQYGSFALLHGLASSMFLPFMKQGRPSEPLAALHASGYRLEAYDASGLLYYGTPPVE